MLKSKTKFQWSVGQLILFVSSIAMFATFMLTQSKLNSARSKLTSVFADLGVETLEEQATFSVNFYGNTSRYSAPEELGGAISVAVSDFRNLKLVIEYFDGDTQNSKLAKIEMVGHLAYVDMVTHQRDFDDSMYRVISVNSAGGRWGELFFIPSSNYLIQPYGGTTGPISDEVIYALVFFERSGQLDGYSFFNQFTESTPIAELKKLATDFKIQVLFFRFEKNG